MGIFLGIDFETGYLLFTHDFSSLSGVYIIYTQEGLLDIGITSNLKTSVETHPHTREWISKAQDNDIYVAFHPDKDVQSRTDIENYLKSKINLEL